MSGAPDGWLEGNRQVLSLSVARLRDHLEGGANAAALTVELERVVAQLGAPSALDLVAHAFGLTPFERNLLLLCAAVELDGALPAACAAAAGDPRRAHPTFSLALAVLPGAHWSALSPSSPLRRFRLVELEPDGEGLAHGRLRIDERILHFLTGTGALDPRLDGIVDVLPRDAGALPASQELLVDRLIALWSRRDVAGGVPLVQLCGGDATAKLTLASAACARVGLRLYRARAADVPAPAFDRELVARLWHRETLLQPTALVIELDDADGPEVTRALAALLERLTGFVLVATRDSLRTHHRVSVRLDVSLPSTAEQELLWRTALGASADGLNGAVTSLVSQFSLGLPAIRAASLEAVERASQQEAPLDALLWDACRVQARPRLDHLAQRIDAVASWDDIVLPTMQLRMLRDLCSHVRQRARVYDEWGFGRRAGGLGISALFAGLSGTGKTMAAEVLARELRLDLYRVDLSQVVSKYIGETEKNLRRIFDAAEEGGVILLFDEADALFGKRSEVKDSHDRYANLEVSYLLQRMEAYRGLAILTTNMRTALDVAFLRRLRFIVDFPFPDAQQRAEIWSRVFPVGTPTHGLDPVKLARLHVAGGAIRNIALNAAFVAADENAPVQMRHLLHGARVEYLKIERQLNEAEVSGWT